MDYRTQKLSTEDLNRMMIDSVRSFHDFSDSLAKCSIEELAPPFESYQAYKGDIISYCMDFFDKYNKHLDELDDEHLVNVNLMMHKLVEHYSGAQATFDLKKDVRAVEEMIVETLVQYFKGLPSESVTAFEKRMLANKKHLFLLIPQLTIESNAYYRVRPNPGFDLTKGKDLFHVPFDLRIHCGSYRYSIPGYPSLYLAKRLNVAKLETEIKDCDVYYAACFRPKRALCFIDLALPPLFNSISDRYSFLVFYPLMMACGLQVRYSEAPFKPEYVLPQVMAQVFRLHENKDSFDGFSYVSTKVVKPNFMDINMRNFVLWIKGADEESGYSQQLADIFTVSSPIKCKGDKPTDEIEKKLLASSFYPVLD